MTLSRSLLFTLVFYVWSASLALLGLPILWLAPRSWTVALMRFWAGTSSTLVSAICGVRVEIRGREHLPQGAALVAAKHQCMLDTMAPLTVFGDAAYVMKQELLRIPVYGWYSRKVGMIVIDREANAKALRKLLADARSCVAQERQVVIFPEGHRMAPGVKGDYKAGVAALYRDLGLPCVPMATNSGEHWPAHGFLRRPGLIVYEFLDPIPAGLNRADFMRVLEERLEAASTALLGARD
jgi:1-acyl-sn-glycerol-3-phosphate acyltransferase